MQETIQKLIAARAAEILSEMLFEEHLPLIQEAVEEATTEVVGDIVNIESELFIETMIEIAGRIVVTAV